MPFKGDMRLGGRHSNVASLNGTASDIVSVPAYGTVLSGPTDTSRYENDYNGTPFYMPYSTTVYADGLGGQTSVETWGLQYYPAGWVTSIGSAPQSISWSFTTAGPYGTHSTAGSASYGYETYNNVEDGTGINSPAVIGITYTLNNGDVMDSSTEGTSTDRWRVAFYNNFSPEAVLQDYTMYPTYGTQLSPAEYGNNFITTPCSNIAAGSWYNPPQLSDGFGGSYNDGSSYSNYDGYPNGSFLQECGGQYLYSTGNGYTTGYAPYGTPMSESSSSSLHWQSPNFANDNTEGDFTWATSGCTGIADGYGNMITQSCGMWAANSGDPIASGTYWYSVGDGTYQEDGTTEVMQNHTVVWSYTYNYNGNFNSNISDTYVLS